MKYFQKTGKVSIFLYQGKRVEARDSQMLSVEDRLPAGTLFA
jgi:hypothetical protein